MSQYSIKKLKSSSKRLLSLILCFSLIASLFVGQIVTVNALTPDLDKKLSDYEEKVNVYHFYQYADDPATGGYWASGPWAQKGESYTPLWQYDPTLTGLSDSLLNTTYFRTESGLVAYCLDYGKSVPTSKLTVGSQVSTELRRVLMNGYPVKTGADYGISDIELEWATSVALQIVDGKGYNSSTGELVPNSGLKLEYFDNGVFSLTYSKENYPGIPDDVLAEYTKKANKVKDVVTQLVESANDTNIVFDDLRIVSNTDSVNIPVNSNKFSIGPLKVESTIDDLSYKLTPSIEGANIKLVDKNDSELSSLNADQEFYIKGESNANLDLKLEVYSKNTPVYPYTCFSPEAENEQNMYIVAPLKLSYISEFNIRKDIELTKTDASSGNALEGAQITVSNILNNTVFSGTTNESGKVTISGLDNGTYHYSETNVLDGYVKNTKTYTFTINADGTVTGDTSFSNTPTKVTITKYDTKTNKPLAGAKISVISEDDKVVASGITDTNGKFEVSYLPIGKYKFLETSAPEGYSRVDNYFYFEILEDGTVTGETSFGNTPNKVVISKTNSETNKPIANAVFKVVGENSSYSQSFTTDENGLITIEYIPAGSYWFQETSAPEGYMLNTTKYYFTVDNEGVVTGTTHVVNNPISRNLVITKIDAENKKLLSDAEFDIFPWDTEKGEYSKTKYCTLTNNNDGTYSALLTYTESNGGKFKLVEVKAPQDYLYEDISEEISILPDSSEKNPDYTSDIELTVKNKINKKEVLAEIKWIDNNNVYNTRPDKVTLSLFDGFSGSLEQDNKDDSYSYKFSNLTIYKDKDVKYNYQIDAPKTLEAKNKDSYNLVSVVKDETSSVEKYIVTYRLTGKINIDGTVLWDDASNVDGLRPSYVDVSLDRKISNSDTKENISAIKTLNTFDFGSFDKYNQDGVKYEYYISQSSEEYYSTTYRDDIVLSSDEPFAYNQNSNLEILNVHIPTTSKNEKTLTLVFNNVFNNNGNPITNEDYDKVALASSDNNNFSLSLRNTRTNETFNASLNSHNQLVISGLKYDKGDDAEYLPETKYEVSINGNQYFSFTDLSLTIDERQDITIEKENDKYYIVASSDVDNVGYGYLDNNMDIVDWRGYSSIDTTNDHSKLTTDIQDFEYEISDNTIIISKYKGESSKVIIPASYNLNDIEYNVVIAKANENNNVFVDTNAKYVVFENGVTFKNNDAQYAFANSNITEVYGLPSNISNLDFAFLNATSLKYIDSLPTSVTTMEGCFKNCSNLETITSFENLSSLENIKSVFENCSSLTKAPSMFGCSNIKDADKAFCGCSNLQGFVPIGSKNIASAMDMFKDTSHVITVCIPSSSQSFETINTIYKNNKHIVVFPVL